MSWLAEPLGYAFFSRALAAAVLVGAMCGAMSTFVVLRRMSYAGHGLAHSVLGGVAVGVALGHSAYAGAAVATLLSAVLIDRIARRRGLHADAAIGIVTTAFFAVGIAVVSVLESQRINTESILFGSPLAVTRTDLWFAAAVAAAFAAILFVWYKPLVQTAFDAEIARVHGVRTGAMEVLFNLMIAGVIIASVRVLGVLLVAAAVVIPAALARLLTRSFGAMLALATAVGLVSGVAGLYASYHADVPSGATIVLVGAALFALVAVATSLRGRGRLARARARAGLDDPERLAAGEARS